MTEAAAAPDDRCAASVCRTALAVSMLAAFLTPFMASSLNLAMPFIGKEFGLSAVTLGWVPTVYILAAAMLLVPFGRLADLVGRKRILAMGLVLDITGSLIGTLAPSAPLLILARVVQGVGGAMIFGTSVAILTSVYPPESRGRALGLSVAATYTGLSLGPVLGGFFVHAWGWRSIFAVTVPIAATALILTAFRLKGEWADARGERFDLAGAVVFGASLISLMYGFSRLPSTVGIALTVGGALALAGFAALELRISAPLLDLGLFRHNRIFAFSNLAALINYSSTWAVGFLLSLYLQDIRGLGPREAGLVLIAQPVLMALCSPFAGRLSDRTEPRLIASVGMGLTAAALVVFGLLRPGTPFWVVVAGLAVLGVGFGLFSSPNTNAVMGSVDRRSYGVASATLGTMRLSGQMFSAGLMMMLFSLFLGRQAIIPELYPVFMAAVRTAFVLYAGLCFAGVFASLARGNRPKA